MKRYEKGISKNLVERISFEKGEPDWMRTIRLTALEVYEKSTLPAWVPEKELEKLNIQNMHLYIRPTEDTARSWDDVPDEIRKKYDDLGIPKGEQQFLAGVGAQYESEMIYHSIREDLEKDGVIFMNMSEAVEKHPDLVKEYFGTLISPDNNPFAALNTAVWSGGSFVYIPEGVSLGAPLHNFFQMQEPSQGQFERTLIIADEGSSLEFLEGCVAPMYSEVSLHAGVVEIFVKKHAKVRYSTMQNWSKNVYNLVTKSSRVDERGSVEWVDGNIGSGLTMKYPSMILAGRGAKGRLLSLAFAGDGQVIDSGGKAIHLASETSAQIESKSVLQGGGVSRFRGNVYADEKALKSQTAVECVALHMDSAAVSETFPMVKVRNGSSIVDHEASVLKISREQLLYLQSRGFKEDDARSMIIGGFIDPFTTQLPMEYAVEFDRLVEMEIKNGVG